MKNVLFFSFLVWILLLGSCQQHNETSKGKSAKSLQIKPGGNLKLSLSDYPVTFFPLQGVDINSTDIIYQLYDGLVAFSPKTLDIVPSIAERWEMDSEGKKYTFHLRKDVYFHDNVCFENNKGRNLNAHDVEYTLYTICTYHSNNLIYSNTLKNKILGADEYYNQSKKKFFEGTIDGIQIIDNYTISIELKNPDYNFLQILAMPSLGIFPKEAFEKYGFSSYVGSGPFKIVNPEKMQNELILVKHNSYYAKDSIGNSLPYLDSVTFLVSTSKRFEMEEFKKRNIDVTWGMPSELIKSLVQGNIENFQNDSLYSLKRIPEFTTQFYVFNLKNKIFQNQKVRQAINMAIDKNKIIQDILKGEAYSSADYGITPPGMKDYNVYGLKGYSYNPEEAKKLMNEAGYNETNKFPKVKLKVNNDGRKNVPIAVEISKQLERNIGISIEMDIVNLSDKLSDEFKGNSDMYRSSWTADYPAPENFLSLFFGELVPTNSSEPSYPNTSRFKDADFDAKFKEALQTPDKNKRNELMLQAEQVLIEKAPFIPLYYEENYALVQSYVHDFHFNSLKLKDLSLVFISK